MSCGSQLAAAVPLPSLPDALLVTRSHLIATPLATVQSRSGCQGCYVPRRLRLNTYVCDVDFFACAGHNTRHSEQR
eukprot:2072868-Pleurochrysis_carterae.AAC.1